MIGHFCTLCRDGDRRRRRRLRRYYGKKTFWKKNWKFKKKFSSNRHGITLSTDRYGRMLSRIFYLLKDFGVSNCLVRSLPLVYTQGWLKSILPFRDGSIQIIIFRGLNQQVCMLTSYVIIHSRQCYAWDVITTASKKLSICFSTNVTGFAKLL